MATNLMIIGKSKAARRQLLAALEQVDAAHPRRAQILQSLALLELAQGRHSDARKIVDEVARIEVRVFPKGHPRHAGREKLLAWIEFGEGNWKQAEARLSTLQCDEIDMLELNARIALKHKDRSSAIALLEGAIQIGRDQGTAMRGALTLYAELMRKQERFAEVARAEQQLITLETRSALAAYRASSR